MSNHKLTREQKEKAVEIAIQRGDFLDYLRKCGSKNPSAAWFYIRKTLKEANPNKYLELIHVLSHPEQKEPEKEETEKGPLAEVCEKLPPEAVAEIPEADPLAGFQVVNMDAGGTVKELEKTDDGVRFVISVTPEQAEQMDKVLKDIMDPENDRLGLSLYKDAQRITEPLKYDGFRVTAINGEFGEYNVGMNPVSKENWFEFESLDKKTRISMYRDDLAAFVEELTRAAQILGVQV